MSRFALTSLVCFAVALALERGAAACPFCGGWGSPTDGLFQTLAMLAVFGLGVRAIWRGMNRRRAAEREPATPDESVLPPRS